MTMTETTTCILCGAPAVCHSGHVHNEVGEKILAGWCATHHHVKQHAESSVFPPIAKAFPNRAVAWATLTKNALPGCVGCFGVVSR